MTRAIVTGAASGIGRAIADALAAAGAEVIGCDIRPGPGDVEADVSIASDVRRLVDCAGPIDVLINNASIVRRTKPTDPWDTAITDFDDIIGTNLRGAFLVGRAVIPGMIERGGGHIVNVATDHLLLDTPRSPSMDVYDASKWGLTGLTQGWAAALRPHRIRVNTLCVGATDTPMLRSYLGGEPDPALVATWHRPEHVAGVVLALLAEGPDGRTGEAVLA